MTEGEACDIVKNTTADNGLEAWRKLTRRFDPHTGQRKRNLMSGILQPGNFKLSELSSSIEQWDEENDDQELYNMLNKNRGRGNNMLNLQPSASLLGINYNMTVSPAAGRQGSGPSLVD